MIEWIPIDDDAPAETEVFLWLRAEEGSDKPFGIVIASYRKTAGWMGWCEKTVSGNINTGLRQDLITHYAFILDGGPDGQNQAGEFQAQAVYL